jgi:hypothetical protein
MEAFLKKINFRSENDKPLKIDASTIPTLIPKEAQDEWLANDENPYYKIQEIKYPIVANGYTYTESFFESFINKLNKYPIPGSKNGHETQWGKRAPTDILLVGGKLEKSKDGKGKVYFKNYFPPVGDSGSNEILIKEAKSNMIEFSLVSYTKDERIEKADSYEINVIESLFGERNDVVEYGAGAMEQKTNTLDITANGGNNNEGDSTMTLDEALKVVSNALDNNNVSITEISEKLNFKSKLITAEHTNAITVVRRLNEIAGDNPVEFVEKLMAERKANQAAVKSAKLTELFGAKVLEDKKENVVREFAEQYFDGKDITDDEVAKLKENKIFKQLAAQDADYTSKQNQIGIIEDNDDGEEESDTISYDY